MAILNPLQQHYGALNDFYGQASQSGNKSAMDYFHGEMSKILQDPELAKQLGNMFEGGEGEGADGAGASLAGGGGD